MIHELGLTQEMALQPIIGNKCYNRPEASFAVYGVSGRTHEPYLQGCNEEKTRLCAGCRWESSE